MQGDICKHCLILGQNRVDVVDNQTAVDIIINGHNRSKTAGTDAAAGFQRELTVGGAAAVFDTELLGQLAALAHGLESYLSPKSTDISAMFAMYAMRGIWDVLTSYPENFSYEMRKTLLYASCAAGIAISITGTGFPHPLGYSLTLLDGIPHGAACAIFDGDYIEYNERTEIGKAKMQEIYAALGTTPRIMKEYLPALAEVELTMTAEQIEEHIDLISGAKNYANSPYVITREEMTEIYAKHFAKSARKSRK